MNEMNMRDRLLCDSPLRLFVSMSLPGMAGMIIVGLYTFADGIFVGQMVGSTAMGAVSISFSYTLLNTGIAALIGIGSASVLSRAMGRGDQETMDKVMGNMLLMNIMASLIITLVGVAFTPQLLDLSGATGELKDTAVRYLRIFFCGSIFMNFSNSANQMIRGEGRVKQAMLLMAAGAVINIILDPIFIALLHPYGRGVEGAALASILAQAVQAAATFLYLRRKKAALRITSPRLEKSILPEVVSVGVSAMLLQVLILAQRAILYKVVAPFGAETWHVLLGAVLSIQAFVYQPLWGIGQGFQPVAGINYGAGEYKRLRRLFAVFAVGGTGVALLLLLPLQLAPAAILRFFIRENHLALQGVPYMRIFFSSFALYGFMILTISLLQAMGKAKQAILLVLLRQVLLFAPIERLLSSLLGIKGVWLGPVATDLTVALIAALCIMNEFSRKNPAQRFKYKFMKSVAEKKLL